MRKEKRITIKDRERDLVFKIKEMSALALERWIVKAGLLLASSGVLDKAPNASEAGDIMVKAGKAIAEGGLSAIGNVDFDKAQPLLDDLLGCCWHIADGGFEQQLTPTNVDGVIEDVRTLFTLRKEALAINFGFFADAGQSDSPETGQTSPASYSRKISVLSQPSA